MNLSSRRLSSTRSQRLNGPPEIVDHMIEERLPWPGLVSWPATFELHCAGSIRSRRIRIARLAETLRASWISRQPVARRVTLNATGHAGQLA